LKNDPLTREITQRKKFRAAILRIESNSQAIISNHFSNTPDLQDGNLKTTTKPHSGMYTKTTLAKQFTEQERKSIAHQSVRKPTGKGSGQVYSYVQRSAAI
jgi:hypothetical protein